MEERKTSPATWRASLPLRQNRLASKSVKAPRVAVVGVGNLSRSDDAAGVLVARALSNRECARDAQHLLILEGGAAPENRTGKLRRFAPDLVLIVDAADVREQPGGIRWIAAEEIDGMSASTHSLPLSMLARYLKLELHCSVMFLGIQPASNEIGEHVSAEVLQAVDEIVETLDQWLCT